MELIYLLVGVQGLKSFLDGYPTYLGLDSLEGGTMPLVRM
jgi:hypothetical protein